MARSLITFTSDFGLDDWFVGVVHGVIEQLCPEARVVDLTHAIPPGHIERAAFVLAAAAPDFPPGTVHLVVVDPGVGTERRALAVRARRQSFVGPDNGVLEWALEERGAEVHALTDARYFRQPVSHTFHARDVFGPVAAHLARGVTLASFGPAVTDPTRLPAQVSRRENGALAGRIQLIDRFGNALTNLRAEEIALAFPGVPELELEVRIAGRRIPGIRQTYGESKVGTVVAVISSSGVLEVAQVGGDLSDRLGVGVGDPVWVAGPSSPPPAPTLAPQ